MKYLKQRSKLLIRLVLCLSKYILPYNLICFLEALKNSNRKSIKQQRDIQDIIVVRAWPEGVSRGILHEGIPQAPSVFYNNFHLSKIGNVLSFTFGKGYPKYPTDTSLPKTWEVIYGVLLSQRDKHEISFILRNGKVTVPICLPVVNEHGESFKFADLKIITDSGVVNCDALRTGKWNYFTFPECCKSAKIISKKSKIILGEPVFHKQKKQKRSNPKCVVYIVVDSLSQLVFDKFGNESLMPNTKRFFETGRMFTNHFAHSEWSITNMAGIVNGLYTSNHGCYDKNLRVKYKNNLVVATPQLRNNSPLLSEIFKNEGYSTFGAAGNWRVHPLYQFTKGFDRFLYYGNEMSDRDIIYEGIKHLHAFPERNHYLFLNLFKVHSNEPPAWNFHSEVNCVLENRSVSRLKQKITRKYNPYMTERYKIVAKETDEDLNMLYEELSRLYNNDEIVVCLTADHGLLYLGNDEHLLSDNRIHVPLFVRSHKVKPGIDDTLIQNIDIYPSLLNLCGIDMPPVKNDGRIWPVLGGEERDYILSESIYPPDYKLRLRDKRYAYNLDCKMCDERIYLEEAEKHFWKIPENDKYGKCEVSKNHELFQKYDKIAANYIALFNRNISSNNKYKDQE